MTKTMKLRAKMSNFRMLVLIKPLQLALVALATNLLEISTYPSAMREDLSRTCDKKIQDIPRISQVKIWKANHPSRHRSQLNY
jgi:hypothetical protein